MLHTTPEIQEQAHQLLEQSHEDATIEILENIAEFFPALLGDIKRIQREKPVLIPVFSHLLSNTFFAFFSEQPHADFRRMRKNIKAEWQRLFLQELIFKKILEQYSQEIPYDAFQYLSVEIFNNQKRAMQLFVDTI